MGTFAGSVHFRTEDQELVLKAVRAAGKRRGTKCLVSPALSGWVAVYPEGNGQDLEFGDELAAKVECDVVQVMVHDSDVFCYRYYRQGKLVDEYNSRPDYFGEPERPVEETRGRPEVFAELVPGKVEELRRILEEGREAVFAEEALQQFGEVLGLSNVGSAYEYLEEGETEGVEGWEGFVQVPKGRRQPARPKFAGTGNWEKVRAIEEDLALEMKAKVRVIRQAPWQAGTQAKVLCAAGPTGWLVVEWTPASPGPLWQYPWAADAKPKVLLERCTPTAMGVSADGRLMAICEPGSLDVIVRNAQTGEEVKRFEAAGQMATVQLLFDHDASRLASVAPDMAIVWDMASGKQICQCEGGSMAKACFTPDGAKLLIDETRCWRIISLENGQEVRRVYAGGRKKVPAMAQAVAARVNPEAMRQQTQKALDKAIAMLNKAGAKAGKSQQEIDAVVKQMRQQAEKQIQTMISAARGGMEDEAQEHAICMVSSPDGTMLICGTASGLWVYRWEDVLSGPEDLVETAWEWGRMVIASQADAPSVQSLATNPRSGEIVFGSVSGVVRSMSLANGEVRELLRLGNGIWIRWLGCSADSRHLGCVVSNQMAAIQTQSGWTEAFAVVAMEELVGE